MNAPATPSRPLVLVVDDEVEIRTALQLGLQDEFLVECANSAEEAEVMLALAGYDVILCDHLMPGEDGLPFLVRMHAKYPHVHRVMMTSYINPEILARSIPLAGLAACLTKPIPLAELKATLHKVVGR